MTIAAVMQPYLFPYIGYFQLIAAADVFVVLDDVQYIKGGWINRNRILVNGQPSWITMPVAADGHEVAINRRRYVLDNRLVQQLQRRIEHAYRTAPYFRETMAMIKEAFDSRDANVAQFNTRAIRCVTQRLGMSTPLRTASAMNRTTELTKADLVIDLCRRVGASGYVNPIGGIGLYHPAQFQRHELWLRFLQPTLTPYPQFGAAFVPGLSIIDVMMFNPVAAVQQMLRAVRLVPSPAESAIPQGGDPPVRSHE